MTKLLNGVLLDGDTSGTVSTYSVNHGMRISTNAALSGTLTLRWANGGSHITASSLDGVEEISGDVYGPVFFDLSDAADVGKVVVTWALAR